MNRNLIFCSVAILLTCASSALCSPVFRYDLTKQPQAKPTDSITALTDEKRTVFLVTNAFGIGKATISLVSGQWPKNIVFRFQYEKARGFRRLEGLTITTARHLIQGDMGTSGKMPFFLPDAKGKFDTSQLPAGAMNVVTEERDGAVEATLPSNLFVGSKNVSIQWVDAYR